MQTHKLKNLPLFISLIFVFSNAIAQDKTAIMVDSIAKLVEKYYVSIDVGEKISDTLLKKNKAKIYSKILDPKKLANQLTADLRSVNGDLHMYVQYRLKSDEKKPKTISKKVDEWGKWSNYGFNEIKVLDGNIGYLKISHFTNWKSFEAAKKVITSSINNLKNTDALILDVRNNSGGFEAIVAYLISYFYDGESIHLSDYYYRYANERYGVHTTVDIPGTKLPNIPLYVLVNGRTASAGESLAYMLKHLKRATVIGEVTAGAGNGAMRHRVNDEFLVTIASEETINTVTKTSFEKVGVIPNIKTSSEDAYNTGYRLALEHLKKTNDSIHPSNYDKVLEFISTKKEVKTTGSKAYQKYVGRYKGTLAEIIISIKGEHLYAEIVGRSGQIKLIPKGSHIFLVDGEKERIRFVLNEKNEAIKLVGVDSPMDLEKVKEK
jgi:C-terminal processing protease CtpA/Prc